MESRWRALVLPRRIPAPVTGFRVALGVGAPLLAALLSAQPPSEPPAATLHETIEVTAVTVAVRVEGGAGRGEAPLAAGDLVVREDGAERRVVSLVPLAALAGPPPAAPAAAAAPPDAAAPPPGEARATRVAIYLDVPMTSARALAAALRRLADLADRLVAAGEVEVVLADPEPRRVVAPTRDARALAAGLRALVGRGGARTAVEQIRLPLLRGEDDLGGHRDQLVQRAQEEVRFVAGRRLRLAVWAGSTPSYGRPRILYLVSGGYDSDPRDFYLERLRTPGGGASGGTLVREPVSERTLLESDLERLVQGPAEATLGGDLATLGWLVFPVAFGDLGFETFGGAEEPGDSRWLGMARGSTYGTTGAEPLLFTHPLAGWTTFAAPTGGTALGSERDLARAVRGLGDLCLLTYERSGPLTGATHRLAVEVRRPGFAVHAPARVSEGTPESAAAVATVRRLAGGPPEGDLPVVLDVAASRGEGAERELTIAIRVAVEGLAAAVGPSFGRAVRVTLAAPDGSGSANVLQKLTAAGAGATGAWTFELTARVPAGARELAVRVEDLASGLAGSAVLDLAASARDGAAPGPG